MKSPFSCFFLLTCLVSSQKIPRLKLIPKDALSFTFPEEKSPKVMFYDADSKQVLIGGQGMLWVLNFTDSEIVSQNISLKADEKAEKECRRKNPSGGVSCDNFIRVIEKWDKKILICGTNAAAPKCWFLINTTTWEKNRQGQTITLSGENIVPGQLAQNALAIAVEGNLYSALSGSKSSIRRSYGNKNGIKTESNWLGNAEFVGAAVIAEKNPKLDEIFFFYNEVNQTAGLDEQPYRAQLGRVCKEDPGAASILTDAWSTFLKARLVCGHPNEPMRFHHLRDVFVFTKNGRDKAVVYGVFSSTWGSSAVCSYSIDKVSSLFQTSNFKGATGSVPNPRPGKCLLTDTYHLLPRQTLTFIKEHPELDTVIYPDDKHPLYVLQNNDTYTHVVVDRVQDVNNESYDVLFLGTGKGKIHKVLRSKEQTVIIAEISPFKEEEPITSMILDSVKGYLYVSTKAEVTRLPLMDCDQYSENCWKCVLARDPYCGWDMEGRKCSAISHHENSTTRLLQNLDSTNITSACETAEEKLVQEALKKVNVDRTSYIYLPCPLRSHHAIYTWVKDDKIYPCSMDDQSCTLRFGESTPMDQGVFRCTAKEEGYQEEITAFKVTLNGGRIPEVSLVVVATGILFLTITILLL